MKLLIVDDHPVVLNGTKALLEPIEQWSVHTEQNPDAVMERLQGDDYTLCLLDIHMKPINGVELAAKIKATYPETYIILYTGFELTDYYELLSCRKVDGLLSKTATKEQVVQTISATLRNEILIPADFLDFMARRTKASSTDQETILNEKELAIVKRVAQGWTNKAIAVELGVTQRTIENHLSKIFTKLHVESRAEAAILAKEQGWID
ncbi:response regulator [Lysinibacillus sp. LZ02]|uniref:response regulator n=1 Tax=Lysinibacillus sp. LZ02 TaxID=3420668 RepID=UPI003D35C26E